MDSNVLETVTDYILEHLDDSDKVTDFDIYIGIQWRTKQMDNKALEIVKDYILEHLDKSDEPVDFDVYIVWKCKALQNWKYLLSSTLFDGMYYELTFNGNKHEWYLDAYKKFENRCIKET